MKDRNEMALLRFSIIAPLVNGTYEEASVSEYVELASEKTYHFKGEALTFSKDTIRRWYYNYKKEGYEALVTVQRADYKESRVLTADAKSKIQKLLRGYPRITAKKIYKILIEDHIVTPAEVSERTVQRYVRNLRKSFPDEPTERRRFRCENPNDMWQSDTSSGPYIVMDGKKYRTYLIMFLDDYSRLITGYGFYLNDNAINMQLTFKDAVKTYGVPRILYVDNGGPYINQQLKIICARIGTEHRSTRAYDPQSKGKIERCFRTIKDQWMNGEDWNKFKSLSDVMRSFGEYVIRYNNTIHGATDETPNDAFHGYEYIKRIPPEKIDAMFYHEVRRTADATACISIDKRKYEVPRKCRGVECVYTYDPQDLSCVYYEGEKCRLLDEVANSKKKRRVNISFQGIVNAEDDVLDMEDETDEIS